MVGVAYVSRWYPKGEQGTTLGIFGLGNVGAAVTKFFLISKMLQPSEAKCLDEEQW